MVARTNEPQAVPQELLAVVLGHLDEGVLVVDRDGRRLYANEEAARLTGYDSPAELLAAPPEAVRERFEIRDDAGRPLTADDLPGRRALGGDGSSERVLIRFRTPGGAERVSEVRAVAVDEQHIVTFFREITGEIAARDETEALLVEARRTTALLDALYGSAPVGLGFWDRDLRYVRVNEALAAINERSPEDHIGRTLGEVVPQLAHVLEPLARGVIETGEAAIGREMTGGTPATPEAERHWLASYYPVVGRDGEVIGVGAVVEETTARRRAEQRTELQHAVTRFLAGADAVDTAVVGVLRAICGTLGWDVACYWPADPDAAQVTWARPGAGLEGFVALTERASLSQAMLPGRVISTGVSEWVADVGSERAGRAPVAEAEGLRSGFAFPVVIEHEVVGVVEAFTRFRIDLDPDLVASLEALGGQLGQFLRRKRAEDERSQLLRRERAARAEAEAAAATLRKLGRVAEAALAHANLQDLLDALLQRIVEVLEADTAAILLLDPDGETLRVRAAWGLTDALDHALDVPLGMGMAGKVALSRSPLLVPDISQIELVSPMLRRRGIRSLVAIPLIAEDRVIGVVHAGSEAYAQFVEDDARLLELIADRIALAIGQAALYDAERAAQERLRFLGEASALLGSTLDLDRTLEQLGALVAGRVADWCAIHLLSETGPLRLVGSAGDVPDEQPDRERAVARVVAGGETEAAPGLLVVPLKARGRTFGAMSLGSRGRVYSDADAEFALDIARRAAVAIDNAQLYSAAAERAQAARVLASVGDGVFLVDSAGYVRTWNRAAALATGLPASEVVDRLATEGIPGWGAIVSRVQVASAGSSAPRAESVPLGVGRRELWISIHGVAVPDGVVYAFRDLTEERALEQMRTEFVSTVSHELRTPLAAIYGAAMTLRRSDVSLAEDQRARLLDVVSGEADRLARTVNDILWASRLDADSLSVSMQSFDIVALVHEVVAAQETHLAETHRLVVDAAPDVPHITGDPDKIGRVLINLVDNAVKYSPDGGTVTVAVQPAASHVRVSVADEGLGIPFAEQRRIFEKFYRLDPDMNRGVGGTGLGLYICRELVRRMEGRIWVDSDGAGRGSVFHVELPGTA
jgi:signal transduction histidine kinase/putative methionine-R-sulfoxide reductase with GAF domain